MKPLYGGGMTLSGNQHFRCYCGPSDSYVKLQMSRRESVMKRVSGAGAVASGLVALCVFAGIDRGAVAPPPDGCSGPSAGWARAAMAMAQQTGNLRPS